VADDKFILGVDLDGVCADFYTGLLPIAAEWTGADPASLPREVSWGLVEWGIDKAPGGYEALHRFAVTQRDFFRTIPVMPGAPQALRKLSAMDVRIRIITHRLFIKYFHQVAVSQTVEWLDHHDIPYWDLCFMREKADVGAHLYIEDSPENIATLRAAGKEVIVFTSSPNRDVPGIRADDWDQAMQIVIKKQASWLAERARIENERNAQSALL
jgi:5'(3')-deoxyribonucleotidase